MMPVLLQWWNDLVIHYQWLALSVLFLRLLCCIVLFYLSVSIDGEYEFRKEVPLAEDSGTDQAVGHSSKYDQLPGEHQCVWRSVVTTSLVGSGLIH